MHIHTLDHIHKLEIFEHLSKVEKEDSGWKKYDDWRQCSDSRAPKGEHVVFVMEPPGMSLRTLQNMQPIRAFKRDLVVDAVKQIIMGLGFLHDADVVHTNKFYRRIIYLQ